mgnify:CR=1 FL=1
MIQRLQTLYLFFVFIFSSGLLYSSAGENTITLFSSYYGFILSPIVTVIAIVLFKKRPLQIFLCFVLLLLQAIQSGFLSCCNCTIKKEKLARKYKRVKKLCSQMLCKLSKKANQWKGPRWNGTHGARGDSSYWSSRMFF